MIFCRVSCSNKLVVFNKPIDQTTFTIDDLTFALQGVKLDVSKVGISTTDNKTFSIDFSELNKTIGSGYNVFTVQTSDITDNEGYKGKVGKSASWIMFKDGFVTLNTEPYPKSAGHVVKTVVNATTRAVENTPETENKAEYGSKVRMEPVANEGYEFLNWTSNGEILSTEPVYEYMALNDIDIVANFKAKNYNVTIDYDAEVGNVTGASSGYLFHEDVIGHVKDPYKMTVFNPTGINGIYVNGTNTIYNTLGQKVKKAANKGIYIYNKKKVVIDRISKTDAQ